MSNQVDFAFQGDVINLGSLTHMLTGRVLKALSDGKVDIYAVGAAFWLGARVPIRSTLADTVHAHVAQRRGYQSVLSKALSIGWGHSTPVVEMTRTRAGTNALLLVGALATGSTPFQAAQCLSELLGIFGISLERLPSVDVLKELAAYLTPFVHDLGFSKVLQHITDVVEGSLEAEILSQSANGRTSDRQPLWELRHLGSASALAGAIKQLIYTSENRQDHYIILEMRGSWLPAFASHLLGMSVELRCHEKLLWACAGEKGSVTFQLGRHPIDKFSIQPLNTPQILIESPETSHQDLVLTIDYSIGDAVEAILAKRPQIDPDIAMAIHSAIQRMSRQLYARLSEGSTGFPHKWSPMYKHHQTTGGFDNMGGLDIVLRILGIRPNQQQSAENFPRQVRNAGDGLRQNPVQRVHEEPPWSSPSSSSSSSALTSPSSSRSPSPVPLPPWPSPPVRPLESPVARVRLTSLPQASTLATQSEQGPSVAESTEEPLKIHWQRPGDKAMGPTSHGLTYMARDQVLRLAGSCDFHRSAVSLVADSVIDDYYHYEDLCICEQIGALIHNTSVVALALAHCKFDPLELRIPETSLTKRRNEGGSWSAEFLPSQHKSDSGRVAMFDGKISDKLMVYLAEVFLEDYSDEMAEQAIDKNGLDRGWWQILGISGGTYTIHYSCIMENDCYDNFGRIISIRTGRASVAGSFRNVIGENTIRGMDSTVNPMRCRGQTMAPSLLAGGTLLQPHYRPSKTKIFMDVALHETVIELELQVDIANSRNRYWGFKKCLVALLSGVIVPSCEHGLSSGYVLKKDREVAIEGFHMARFTRRSSDQILVLALQGNKLEQLLACGMLMRELEMEQVGKHRSEPGQEYSWWKRGVLQTSSCLECCIRLSQRDDNCLPWVIIGG